MLFSKKIEPIALDIGSTFIKLVQLKGSNKNYQLIKFGMVPLPPEVIVEGAGWMPAGWLRLSRNFSLPRR